MSLAGPGCGFEPCKPGIPDGRWVMKKWLSITLGIVTATGGFLDAGTIATSGESGARFGLGLIWASLIATGAIILLVEMMGRFSAVSKKTSAEAIRENFVFKFYLLPLLSEVIAESILLAAEIGGIAIALSLVTGISYLRCEQDTFSNYFTEQR